MDSASKELVDEQIYVWTEMHKKSATTHLILGFLEHNQMWSKDLGDCIQNTTSWDISERSLYRLLRRMQKQGLIKHELVTVAKTGASRKVYEITPVGLALLAEIQKVLVYQSRL